MKIVFVGLIAVALLSVSGCAEMVERQNKQNAELKADLMECSTPTLNKKYLSNEKSDFINQLNYLAGLSYLYNGESEIQMKRLSISMMGSAEIKEVANSIGDCNYNQNTKLLQLAQPLFDKRKLLTTDKTEKEYLIKAYSEWESYIKNNTGKGEQESVNYDAAISMYKNY